MLRALRREKRPYRAWLAEHPDRKAIFERLEWLAWSTLLWGLEANDPKVIRFYRANFRRLPDGSARFKRLSRSERLKGIEPSGRQERSGGDMNRKPRAQREDRFVSPESGSSGEKRRHGRAAEPPETPYASLAALWSPRKSKPKPPAKPKLPRLKKPRDLVGWGLTDTDAFTDLHPDERHRLLIASLPAWRRPPGQHRSYRSDGPLLARPREEHGLGEALLEVGAPGELQVADLAGQGLGAVAHRVVRSASRAPAALVFPPKATRSTGTSGSSPMASALAGSM